MTHREPAPTHRQASGAAPGSADGWLAFFDEHRDALVAYSVSLTGSVQDAEELIQDVLVAMVSGRRRAQGDRAYVFASLRNRAADVRRRVDAYQRMRQAVADSTGGMAYTIGRAGVDERDDQWVELRRAVGGLPAAHQEVLVLRLRSGLSLGEIANVLSKPVGTVASDYARAVEALRKALAAAPAFTEMSDGSANYA